MPTNLLLTNNFRLIVTSLFNQNLMSCVWAPKDSPEMKKTTFENPVSIKGKVKSG